jgi:hypothetical protein
MSVRQEVLSELETKLTTLVDAFGKYMADVVSEKSIKMEDDEEDVDATEDDKEDDVDTTDDDSKDDSTDDDEDKKTVDEKQKKSKK